MTKRSAEASAADHAYFQALEDAFIRLRGAPLLLSPADWQVAKEWRGQGIPLELATRVMERIFERRAEAGGRTGIRGLRYFRSAVEGSWRRIRELGGGEPPAPVRPPLDVAACLERLAAALPASPVAEAEAGDGSPQAALAGALEGVREAISSLRGSTRQVEAELQRLDRQVMDRLREGIDPRILARLESSIQESLSGLSPRLRGEVRDHTAEILVRRRLREEFGLPVLSLFSPEAGAAASAAG